MILLGTHFLISREKFPHRYRRTRNSYRHATAQQNAGGDLRDKSPAGHRHHHHRALFLFVLHVFVTLASRRQVCKSCATAAVTLVTAKQSATSFRTNRVAIDRLVHTGLRSRLPLRFMLTFASQWRLRVFECPHFIHVSGFRVYVSTRSRVHGVRKGIYAL